MINYIARMLGGQLSIMINYIAILIFLGMVEVYAGRGAAVFTSFLAGLGIGAYIGIEIMKWRWRDGGN